MEHEEKFTFYLNDRPACDKREESLHSTLRKFRQHRVALVNSSTLGDQHTLSTENNKAGAKTGFAQLDLDVAPWQRSKGKRN